MSSKDRADITQIHFFASGPAGSSFSVQKFSGREKISQLYSFEITLTSEDRNVSLEDIINQSAILLIYRKGEFYSYSGIVSEFTYCETTTDYSVYKVKLVPWVWILTLSYQSRIFQNINIPDIIKQILDESGLDTYYKFYVDSNAYPKKEYVVQYEETDFNFISRLMEANGIWYLFKELPILAEEIGNKSPGGETLIITDNPEQFKEIPSDSTIPFRTQSEMVQQKDEADTDTIFDLKLFRRVIPEKVVLRNFNYRDPGAKISSEKNVRNGDVGQVYEYGGDFKNLTEAEKCAEIESRRIATEQLELKGQSSCRGFRAGNRIEIIDHKNKTLNQHYLITQVEHAGKFSDSHTPFANPYYLNTFHIIPSENANFYIPKRSTKPHTIPGILTGKIESMDSDYASLDDQGRYKVRMPYDMSDTDNYEASKYIRLAQAYSGSNYGIHFPSHEKAEMVIGHINDNANKSIGLGTVPNPDTLSPVTKNNKTQSIIRTAGKNEINLDDQDGTEKMSFSTPKAMSITVGGAQSISVGNDRSVNVSKNETKSIGVDQTISIQGKKTENISGNKEENIDGNCNVSVTGEREETFQAGRKIDIKGDDTENYNSTRSLEVTATNKEKYSSNCDINISKNYVHSAKAPITLTSDSDNTIEAAELTNVSGTALTIMGKKSVKIEVGGSSIELSPAEVKINSSGNVSTSGALITSLAGVKMVKGMPVNIN